MRSFFLRLWRRQRDLDLPVSLHEEDPLFIVQPGVNQGKVSEKLGYGGASRTAEDIMVARDCVLALHTGASVCIQHISSGNSVDIVRTAKKLGADVHAEATPHHFTLIEDAVLKYGTMARMNPPLRTEKDRRQIIEGIQDGTIDMIVTDHAPHSSEEKARPFDKAPSGITGLETSLCPWNIFPCTAWIYLTHEAHGTNEQESCRILPHGTGQDSRGSSCGYSHIWRE